MKLKLLLTSFIILLAIMIIMKFLENKNIIEKFTYLPYKYNKNSNLLSSYDGVKLQSDQYTIHKWRSNPANKRLKVDKPIKTYQGLSNSILMEKIDGPLMDTSKPPVDGLKNQNEKHNSMFLFRFNQFSPECCPSTYSTSKGCVCTTDFQREFIARRGKLLN